jgi:hypothetical protein
MRRAFFRLTVERSESCGKKAEHQGKIAHFTVRTTSRRQRSHIPPSVGYHAKLLHDLFDGDCIAVLDLLVGLRQNLEQCLGFIDERIQ